MDEFLLKKTDFDWKNESLNEHNGSLNEQRIELLRKRVSYASKLLSKTSDELLMTYNNDENLSELVDKTNYYIWSIEDLFLEQEK
jgi:hypothetical protein